MIQVTVMATFHKTPEAPSPAASRHLHPSADRLPVAVAPEVLQDIAAGLASTIDGRQCEPGRSVLLVTAGYEAAVETVAPEACRVLGGPGEQPLAFAMVSGRVLVWAVDGASHMLSASGVCLLEAGEKVQMVNVGPEPAVVVAVHSLAAAPAPDARAAADHPRLQLVS